jgi:tetratricopeptide (TPR) repeat protein
VLGGASLARIVRRRVDRLPEAAQRLARAVAVAGEDAADALVATLAEMAPSEAAAARDQLARAEILVAGTPPAFVHPVVRAGVLSGLGAAERGAAHARCAALLAASGASVERQAIHLLETTPAGDPAVVDTLRQAAARAVDELAGETAERLLERAVAEPPPDGPGEVLLELGDIQSTLRPLAALQTLARARELLAADRLEVEQATARALYASGRAEEAAALLASAADAAPPGSELHARLEADLSSVGRFHATLYPSIARRASRSTPSPRRRRRPACSPCSPPRTRGRAWTAPGRSTVRGAPWPVASSRSSRTRW